MTIAADYWAFNTDAVSKPLERLALILMADCTDEFGVAVVNMQRLADRACLHLRHLQHVLDGMIARGVLSTVSLPPEVAEELGGGLSVFLFRAWVGRSRLGDEFHPLLGEVDLS